MRKIITPVITAIVAALATALLTLNVGSAGAHSYRTGSCQWNNPRAQVLCVHRADKYMCHDALRSWAPCWAFVGSDTEVIFNWRGRASTS